MNEENKQEDLGITFKLNTPEDITHSIFNTIILLLRDIADMEDYHSWDNTCSAILNNKIEKAKRELDNLKIIKFEEDNKC